MTATSVCGRSWQASRIAGSTLAPTRASTNASRPDGGGSAPTIADDADAAGGAARPAAADAGVRNFVAQARFEHAQALRHAHLPVGIGQRDHAAAALAQRAHAARGENQADERRRSRSGSRKRDVVDDRALRRRRLAADGPLRHCG